MKFAAENQIVVYQPNETVRLDVRLENETVWLTQAQLCALFQRDVSVISRHIKNIFTEGELDKEGNLHFLQIENADPDVVTGKCCHCGNVASGRFQSPVKEAA